jgi:hypothetical protein
MQLADSCLGGGEGRISEMHHHHGHLLQHLHMNGLGKRFIHRRKVEVLDRETMGFGQKIERVLVVGDLGALTMLPCLVESPLLGTKSPRPKPLHSSYLLLTVLYFWFGIMHSSECDVWCQAPFKKLA